jgi:hypothetical protein
MRIIGVLKKNDIAIVIATYRDDGSQVYVLGPNGSGWTYGAYLNVLQEQSNKI